MYLHLGNDTIMPYKEIIAVMDLDTSTIGEDTRDFLGRAEKSKRVVNITQSLPKSFVVSGDSKAFEVYISQLSPKTLAGRVEKNVYSEE